MMPEQWAGIGLLAYGVPSLAVYRFTEWRAKRRATAPVPVVEAEWEGYRPQPLCTPDDPCDVCRTNAEWDAWFAMDSR